MIQVEKLSKEYRVHRRSPGLGAAFRSVFHRTYETVPAVRELSFEVKAGERVGFLGPNGAGKTTTLKMLSGLLHPTSGRALVAGHVPFRREVDFLKKITLVMGQKQQLLWDLPPSETFALNRAVYEIPAGDFAEMSRTLIELLDLGPLLGKPTRQLSLGERMKCELAAALLHRPKVLFLDEPTIGLDVSMQAVIREFIRAYNERFDATVVLTSHYMDDVLALCPRVVVIDQGRLIYDGDLKSLARTMRPDKRIALRLAEPVSAERLASLGTVVSAEGIQVALRVPQDQVNEVVGRALGALRVVDLIIEEAPLEEVMRDLFKNHREGAGK